MGIAERDVIERGRPVGTDPELRAFDGEDRVMEGEQSRSLGSLARRNLANPFPVARERIHDPPPFFDARSDKSLGRPAAAEHQSKV